MRNHAWPSMRRPDSRRWCVSNDSIVTAGRTNPNTSHLFAAAVLVLACVVPVSADTFTYRDEDGKTIEIQARLIGSGQGFQALERRDGQIQIVPNGAILNREPADDPEPIDVEGMQELLKQQFGEDRLRMEVQQPFLVALVLAAPLDRTGESRATGFLKKSARFMKNVDSMFLRYARSMRFPIRDLRYPMVLVIFESDDDFNQYTIDLMQGRGLSPDAVAGFYSSITNWLIVRMRSCYSFEIPLHEAIHQQMYNRVFQRLAPIPKWFDEGIANGFEGSGERVNVHPAKINTRYGRQAQRISGRIDWQSIIAEDGAFTADVLAGDAYTLAWCIHWMLATQYKDQYQQYVKELSTLEPLSRVDDAERIQRFEEIFGTTVAELQADFPRVLQAHVRRQKIDLSQKTEAEKNYGRDAGEVSIEAVQTAAGGPDRLQVEGTILNTSPLRSMTFYVTAETSGGRYAEWLVNDLGPGRTQKLDRQMTNKRAPAGTGGPPGSYRIWVQSAFPGSDEADAWKGGNLPGPISGR
jgi:hypothetical protein